MPPPSDVVSAATPASSMQSLPQLLASHPELSTLTAALKAAGLLDEALSGKGPFTVFAPSNDAFAKLDQSDLKRLLDPKNKQQLQDLLGAHVTAAASLHSADLQPIQNVKSLEGIDLSIAKEEALGEVHVGFPYQLYWPQLPAKVTSA